MRVFSDAVPEIPASVPSDRPVAMLVRHAERPAIPDGSMGMELSITARGLTAATAFGARLEGRIVQVHTSAVRRCVETARAIIGGAGLRLEPIEDPSLGVPSTFLSASPEAQATIRRLGFDKLMQHFIDGDEELPGLPHPAEGARLLREHALGVLSEQKGIHLLVTHDAMIAATVARAWKEPLDVGGWPGFLEAAALWRDGERVMLAYRERCRPIV